MYSLLGGHLIFLNGYLTEYSVWVCDRYIISHNFITAPSKYGVSQTKVRIS